MPRCRDCPFFCGRNCMSRLSRLLGSSSLSLSLSLFFCLPRRFWSLDAGDFGLEPPPPSPFLTLFVVSSSSSSSPPSSSSSSSFLFCFPVQRGRKTLGESVLFWAPRSLSFFLSFFQERDLLYSNKFIHSFLCERVPSIGSQIIFERGFLCVQKI